MMPTFTQMYRFVRIQLIVWIAAVSLAVTVHGQPTYTWTGAVNNQWDTTTANWSGPSTVWPNVPITNVAQFSNAGTINVTSNINLHGINFLTGSTTLDGSTLNIFNIDAATQPYFHVASGASATISSVIAASNNNTKLTKLGDGTLTLTGANTFTGGTTVSAGTLILGNGGSLIAAQGASGGDFGGSGGLSVTVASDAMLQTMAGSTITGGLGGSSGTNGGSGGRAVLLGGRVTLTNGGSITGGAGFTSQQLSNRGGHGADALFGSGQSNTVINTGTIRGGNGAQGFFHGGNGGRGIFLHQGGIVDNSGVIAGGTGGSGILTVGSAGLGIHFEQNVGTLINRGGGQINGGVVYDWIGHTTLYAGSSITGGLNFGLTPNANSTLTLTGDTGSQAFTAAVAGGTNFNGQLTKSGTGTWVLDQALNQSSTTITGNGTLAITSNAALGTGSVTFNSGVLRTDFASTDFNRNLVLGSGAVGVLDTNGNNITHTGTVTGSTGGFWKFGAGTLTLAGSNYTQGNTRIDDGTLAISSDSQLGTPGGPLFMNGGTLRPTADATFNRPMVIAPGTTATLETTNRSIVWNGGISQQTGAPANLLVTGEVRVDPNTGDLLPNLVLTGDASWTGTTTFRSTGGSPYFQIGNFGTTGSLPVGGAVVLDSTGNSSGTVFLGFARSDDYTFDGTISEIPGNAHGTVFQRGPGTLRLTAANTYSGGTDVAGTLIVNGGNLAAGTSGTGSGSVRVGRDGLTGEFSVGTLGGTGRIAGVVNVFSSGTLAPGDGGIGTLTTGEVRFSSSAALRSTLAMEIDLGGAPDADLLRVVGGVFLQGNAALTHPGATLDLSLLNAPSFLAPTTFMLIDNDGLDPIFGQFGLVTGLPSNWTYSLDYSFSGTDALGRIGNGNDFAITLSAIPEPSAGLLTGLAVLGLMAWKRRRLSA